MRSPFQSNTHILEQRCEYLTVRVLPDGHALILEVLKGASAIIVSTSSVHTPGTNPPDSWATMAPQGAQWLCPRTSDIARRTTVEVTNMEH